MKDKRYYIEGLYSYWFDRKPTEEEINWSMQHSTEDYVFIKGKGGIAGHLYILGTNEQPMAVVRMGDSMGTFHVIPNEPAQVDGIPIAVRVETSHYYYISSPYYSRVEYAMRFPFK